jgi:hypothetical protein
MRRSQPVLLFLVTFLVFPAIVHAQAWAGIINSTRATDWAGAGIPGGIPSGSWTQCGSTIAAYTGTAAAINNTIAACGKNQYVLLGPGTFSLSTVIDFNAKSNVVLRGSGANSTFLTFTSTAASGGTCSGKTVATQLIGVCGTDGTYENQPPANIYSWTAGYGQGTNQITLSSTSNITLLGSGNPTMLMLTQNDTGYSGYNPASGSSVDNGNYWVCADQVSQSSPAIGCSDNGPDGTINPPLDHKWQYEIAVATAINGKVVTISPALQHPNWLSTQSPSVWLFQPMVNSGVENLSVDDTVGAGYPIVIQGCYGCWVSGNRVMNFPAWAIGVLTSTHVTVQNNYIYHGTGPDSYGIRSQAGGNNLYQNNIMQYVRSPLTMDFWESGSVVAYNYAVNDYSAADYMFAAFWLHSAGDDFILMEGNIGPGPGIDNIHGTHLDVTNYRNFYTGWESCANGQCGSSGTKDIYTIAMGYRNAARYGNIVGNILGTPNFHTGYITQQDASSGNSNYVYNLGGGNGAVSPQSLPDPLVQSTALLWDNYDVVHGGVQENTSEVPTGAPVYPNSIPTKSYTGAGGGLPASFYLSSRPGWWPGSIPYPPIGPDVSGGNVGQCSGTLNTPGHYSGVPATSNSQCTGTSLTTPAWGGHVNANPAMNCYLNVMSGPPDGTGSALAFDAKSCYGASTSSPTSPLAAAVQPPTNVTAIVH